MGKALAVTGFVLFYQLVQVAGIVGEGLRCQRFKQQLREEGLDHNVL